LKKEEDESNRLVRRQRGEMERFEKGELERSRRMREEIRETRRWAVREFFREMGVERELVNERLVAKEKRKMEDMRRATRKEGKGVSVVGYRWGCKGTRIEGDDEECEKLLP
jgi:hypothetical protein